MHLIQLAGLMVLVLMISALAIDFGFYYASQNQLQTSTDASALAAAAELYRSNSPDPSERQIEASMMAEDYVEKNQPNLSLDTDDITFGFIDPLTKKYEPATFETVSADPAYAFTGGMNAARIRLMRGGGGSNNPLPTIMAKTLGIDSMSTGAFSLAFLDKGVSSMNAGLRPIYACEAQLNKAMLDGVAENNAIRVYGDRMEVDGIGNIAGCPQPGSGNWGFADLRNCDPDAPGANNTATWFDTGFSGTVYADECYSTQSGNFISNHDVEAALDKLIATKTIITIPVYDNYSGGGSNTKVDVSGFAGFVITGYKSNGSASGRYIEGYFTKTVCGHECTTSNDGSGSGGLVVKLRLAYQS
ncbi:MAG TPA: pilus assembly protein TadG-related protein [Coleofasciculaceae cyanobacterium]|jgi:Flp pilus assembly protein TadG